MAKQSAMYGNNYFIGVKVGLAIIAVGCAMKFKRSVKNPEQEVSCPGNGLGKTFEPGQLPEYDFSFSGIKYDYTGADLLTNVGIYDFWNATVLGTKFEFYLAQGTILTAFATGAKVEKTTGIFTSVDEDFDFGKVTPYNVSGKASGGWTLMTLV